MMRAGITTATALVAVAGLTAPAHAAVKSGRSIEAELGRDLVILTGYPRNTPVTVDVLRDNAVIGSATARKTDGTGVLEVNHLGGADCFDGGTAPDIRPGDVVRTTIADTDVDDMIVQNVSFDGQPAEVMRTATTTDPDTGLTTTTTEPTGIFRVTGTALTPGGNALDSIEVRLNHPIKGESWAATGRKDWRDVVTPDSATGRFTADFDSAGSDADRANLPDAATSALYTTPDLTQLSGDDGPGSACPNTPTSAITKITPTVVNAKVASVSVSGVKTPGTSVSVDHDGVVTQDVAAGSTWTATVPAASLAEGDNMVTATYTGAGAPSPDSRLVVKDTIAPGPVSSDLPSGTYATAQTVNLTGENEVRFTTDGSTPTAASARFTAPLLVTTSRTIKAVAIDAAGNVGPVATFAYTIAPPAASEGGTANNGASVPVLGPSVVVLGRPVPVAVPVQAVPGATASTTPAVSRLSLARRVSVTRLRARGLRVSMGVTEGTNVVRIAVYRARNGARMGRAVFLTTRSPSAAGLFRVTLRSSALARLKPGSYVVEVRAGRSAATLGAVSRFAFAVTR